MHTTTSITMRAPREKIFETAADLGRWPEILPHYRYIRYLEKSPGRNVVKMAATRSGIPITWTSEQIIDRAACEVRFTHLRAWTKGMHVVWRFADTPDGVRVEILHDLDFRIPPLAPLADRIIGGFFIEHIANKTLQCMKAHLEIAECGLRKSESQEPA
jgi:ribosome-associated toxin RatA of RatAB toxin-antitoxin module